MKFLIDECLPGRLAKLLAEHGHDAVHVTDLGLSGAPDTEIMAAAAAQDRIVVSADTDFGELLALGRFTEPSVILLRGAVRRPEIRARVILENLSEFEVDLMAGAIVVVGDKRIRVRPLPIEG